MKLFIIDLVKYMVNYPNGKKAVASTNNKETNYGRRGMSLEDDINTSNKYYLETDKAVVYKKPTPIQVVTVDYKSRNTAKITEAYYRTPSTTDYNGVYNGYPLDFEAKETHSRTSFAMKLIHPHQIAHLERVIKQKAIAFLLIRFTAYDETYYVDAQKIIDEEALGKKSLPYSWFKENGYLVPYKLFLPADYLKIVDQIVEKGVENE